MIADGFAFKDLNKNGALDPHEDWRRSPEERATDLASRMSIEQIAGLLLYGAHVPDYLNDPVRDPYGVLLVLSADKEI